MHTPTHTTTLKIRMCRHTGTTTLYNGRSQSMRMARAAAMPQRHGNVGERGKGEKGGKRLTACAEKGTKCDCSSIVPLLVSRQNTAFRVATILPCLQHGCNGIGIVFDQPCQTCNHPLAQLGKRSLARVAVASSRP